MGFALQQSITLETEQCCECGVMFAMPAAFQSQRRADGGWFYCPAGHPQHYSETEASRLRKMLEEANRKNTALAERTRVAEVAEQAAIERAAKVERERKRLLKRAAAGICPCCNRHFTNLERHMATKHKDAA